MNIIRKYLFYNKVKVIIVVVITAFFLMLVLFLDSHNMMNQFKYRSKINELIEERAYYQKKIAEDSLRIHELNTNDNNLEKYAREKYHMKKKNEEIFIIKENK